MEDVVVLKTFNELEQKLDTARQSLISLNDNIRRCVGRGTNESRLEKYNLDNGSKRNNTHEANKTKQKRYVYDSKMTLNRVTKEGKDDFCLPRINSRVIRELPSREEIVEAQGMDSESRARNRRMFGCLLGTLQKFCQEESKLKKNDKKAQIEKKIEIQELQEKAIIQKERNLLFLDRKRKQLEIKCLEKKVARIKDFKTWELSIVFQKNQIQTKTKPQLFFKPRFHTETTEKLASKNKNYIDSLIQRRRDELKAELQEIDCINNIDEYCGLDDSSIYDKDIDSNEFRVESVISWLHMQ